MSSPARRFLGCCLAVLLLTVPAWAETLSAQQFRLKIDPSATITQRVETGWETSLTVEGKGQRARVRFRPDGVTVIFTDGTLRAQLNSNASPTSYELTTDFEGKRYKVTRSAREISWLLPGHEVFFRTFGGKVTSAVGSADFLNITRDSKGGRISLQSQAGTSDVLLKKGTLELFDGPELAEHTYFVRGLAFRRGPLTLELPLPEEPFFNALPADRYLTVESRQPVTDPVEETLPEAPVEESSRGPLEAEPADWNSPVYRSSTPEKKSDPFNARREVRHSSKDRPLDAKTAPNSVDLLQVKDLDYEQ